MKKILIALAWMMWSVAVILAVVVEGVKWSSRKALEVELSVPYKHLDIGDVSWEREDHHDILSLSIKQADWEAFMAELEARGWVCSREQSGSSCWLKDNCRAMIQIHKKQNIIRLDAGYR